MILENKLGITDSEVVNNQEKKTDSMTRKESNKI